MTQRWFITNGDNLLANQGSTTIGRIINRRGRHWDIPNCRIQKQQWQAKKTRRKLGTIQHQNCRSKRNDYKWKSFIKVWMEDKIEDFKIWNVKMMGATLECKSKAMKCHILGCVWCLKHQVPRTMCHKRGEWQLSKNVNHCKKKFLINVHGDWHRRQTCHNEFNDRVLTRYD